MQTALNLSYLCAKTDGVGTKRLTAKKGGKIQKKKSLAIFFSLCKPIRRSHAKEEGEGKKIRPLNTTLTGCQILPPGFQM